jgi:3-isopropylmalate/(R)-2-methylmalate dehydratase large subunit
MTVTEKILARASGSATVKAGDLINAQVDLAMVTDSSGARRLAPHMERLGARVWDPERLLVVADHFVPATGEREAEIQKVNRAWVQQQGIRRFHEAEGICHIIPIERGYLRPGMCYVGGDSHSTTGGGIGAFATGIGSTEMLGVVITGEIWLRVPPTIRLEWTGTLGPAVMAKDMVLQALGELTVDGGTYRALEYDGTAVRALPLDERMLLSNMAVEMGAKAGICPPDGVVIEHYRQLGIAVDCALWSDPDAGYERGITFDAGRLEPLVACPHSPDNVRKAAEVESGQLQQAYIGGCAGAKYEDLAAAAGLLQGRHAAAGTRLIVAPASTEIYKRAVRDGLVTTLMDAGAIVMPSACGACAGLSLGVLGAKERCVTSTNRNFRGRMGAADAEVFLASPLTVAASAVAGHIIDPRELLN